VSALRQPWLHFLVLGGALFAARSSLETPAAPAPPPAIVIDAARLRAEFAERTGLTPTASDEAALVARATEEELLYREALARGLDRDDRSIRHRLAEKMRFLSPDEERSAEERYRDALALGLDRDDAIVRRMLVEKMRLLIATAGGDEADEGAVAAYVAEHAARYATPARVRLWQVFAGRSAAEADRLLASLRAAGVSPEEGVTRGEPFPLGGHIGPASEPQLARLFGAAFASAAWSLPAGVWSGPIASTHGFHLVWVEAREEAAAPALAEVRGRAREALRAARRPEHLRLVIAALRRRYDVRVTGSAS
jgi:hypothetical protein